MANRLETEKSFFMEHVNEWAKENEFQFVLIKNNNLIGVFNSIQEAFETGLSKFGLDDFFIKQILPPNTTNISFLGQSY